MQNVFIFHGVGGYPQENWFPWLKGELEKLGCKVIVPQFPTPQGQTLENWLKVLEKYPEIKSRPILVGHSLGCPFLLNVLERYPAKASFLVSSFTGQVENQFNESMRSFADREFDWRKINANCKSFSVFHSDNDPYLPIVKGREVADKLGVPLTTVSGAGHFNSKSGYTQFPLLLSEIKKRL